ncbi:MAG TPA: carboxymuconolactone decarboxylase family protein [Pseudonocardiaceae bacterium]
MALILRATLRAAPQQVRVVSPVRPGAARGLVRRVYAQVIREFGVLGPPIALHSPAPAVLAAAWMMLRESLLATGLVDRATKEGVAAAVSLGNICPYCVQVHSATMYGLVRGPDAVAIADDRVDDIGDPAVRAIAGWAKASGNREPAARHRPPLDRLDELAELIAVAVTFQHYNRMVNVFLVDSPFPPGVPPSARATVLRVFGRLMRRAAGKTIRPGRSLDLLPPARLPGDLPWAAGRGALAEAFARSAAAVDAAGNRSVPPSVRSLVLSSLDRWRGQPIGISRAWVEDLVAGLAAADRAAGRLALLTAMASYQVDESLVREVRRALPDDRSLVELVSWASLAAARRVGRWLWDDATAHLARM